MAKNDFQYGGWNSYTLQCGTIVTLISPGDCTLQCGMWLWNRDSEFTKWQHPTMWYVALGWHAIEFAQTSAILEFYIWCRFRPHHPVSEILSRPPSAEKNDVMSIFKMAELSHLGFYGSNNECFVKPNYNLLNCLVFQKIAFLHFGIKIQDGGSPPSWILGVLGF